MDHKAKIVEDYLPQVSPTIVWDLGANTGRFSRIALQKGATTISFDIDPAAVEKNYLELKENNESGLLPLVMDLTNPSPGLGWANNERYSLGNRPNPDLIIALALIHHLAISNNLPFPMISEFLCNLSQWLIIEFVPKTDSQVQRLLSNREDIFSDYTQKGFEAAFIEHFTIHNVQDIQGSQRCIYLMERK
jgi:ribosomal protein L11 methylase PrmA